MTRAEAQISLANLKRYMSGGGVIDRKVNEALDMAIKALEESQWISWNSGKLPEESGTYTITAYDGVTNRVTYAKYLKRLKRWELTGARTYWRVLAWKPLEEPWEGDTE